MSHACTLRILPADISIDVRPGSSLRELLFDHGVGFPCGGKSVCGGCRVRVIEGHAPIDDAMRARLSPAELDAGWRLACRLRAEGDMIIETPGARRDFDRSAFAAPNRIPLSSRLGLAVDVGSTTLAAELVDLDSGETLAADGRINPQTMYGSDIMTRAMFSLHDARLTSMIRRAVGEMIASLAGEASEKIASVVLVGNTVMHHLFAGHNLESLVHAPFESPHCAEWRTTAAEIGWRLPPATVIRFLRSVGGFVGSDILAGVAACHLMDGGGPVAMIDLGTNGEIAVRYGDRALCASTAAGPAFESANISCGMLAVDGAIAHVSCKDGRLMGEVIGSGDAHGLCGSGVVAAVAEALRANMILPNGRIANRASALFIEPGVELSQADVRELQLAKAAVASGLQLVLEQLGARPSELLRIYLCGSFGNRVRVESAKHLGLFADAHCEVVACGNTALHGAKLELLSPGMLDSLSLEHFSLASAEHFQSSFVDCLQF
jgi:uncharacterized 2Fe-2S/4Fe-4S cluster protein (DUF4445 family)